MGMQEEMLEIKIMAENMKKSNNNKQAQDRMRPIIINEAGANMNVPYMQQPKAPITPLSGQLSSTGRMGDFTKAATGIDTIEFDQKMAKLTEQVTKVAKMQKFEWSFPTEMTTAASTLVYLSQN